MIPIALLKEFGSYEFITIIEVINMCRNSGKANKLRYINTIRSLHDFLNFVPEFEAYMIDDLKYFRSR